MYENFILEKNWVSKRLGQTRERAQRPGHGRGPIAACYIAGQGRSGKARPIQGKM